MGGMRNKGGHSAIGSQAGEVCAHVEVAETFAARFVGLLGRKGLAEDAGLWLNPSRGVHTFGMRFPIDVVALDADMTVVGLYRNLKAWRVAATGATVRSVLELPAGRIDGSRLGLGERLVVQVQSDNGAEEAER